jgi:hypothetical protein
MGDRDAQDRDRPRQPGRAEPLRDGGDVSDPGASGTGRGMPPEGNPAETRPQNEQAGPGAKPGKRPA